MRYSKLPRYPISMDRVLLKAERVEDVMTCQSDLKHVAYLYEKDRVVILSRDGGCLMLNSCEAATLLDELPGILDNMRIWRAQNAIYGEDHHEI